MLTVRRADTPVVLVGTQEDLRRNAAWREVALHNGSGWAPVERQRGDAVRYSYVYASMRTCVCECMCGVRVLCVLLQVQARFHTTDCCCAVNRSA